MSGNKVNTKGKVKDDKGKGTKTLISTNEDIEDNDFSLLRKPVQTSITGFGQARKIYDLATEELKTLLSDECDLLYECKVCRNIFRSLANFISHKRVYCKDKFNSSLHGHFLKAFSTDTELAKIRTTEEGYQESLKENGLENMEVDEEDDRIPITKDLTAIIEKLSKHKGAKINGEDLHISLQKIPNTAAAVFQNIENGAEPGNDNMRNQIHEIDDMNARNLAVLQSDGNFKVQSENENVIQISDDEDCDTAELKCKLCDMQFATQKTLKFHMKYKHVESRLVYPCPDCLEIFSTSWSVYRHLFKVHRKTAAQIRRMRESIQAKAFRMNNPPAFYEKRRNNVKTNAAQKITEEERLDQENQAWLDNIEGDNEVPRCGGCGRTFERRAALAAHTHTCQPRSRALARRSETKRIEIQIRKDYNKGPSTSTTTIAPKAEPAESTPTKDDTIEAAVLNKQKEVDKPIENDVNAIEENSMDSLPQNDDSASNDAEVPEQVTDKTSDPPKPDRSRWFRLPFAHHAEKSNLMALRQKILPDIQFDNLSCKKCDTSYNNLQDIYDHVAAHYKWVRYACKLCNFKNYEFEKVPEHVKNVHKLKGDKDFYFSTVKALDGTEALELAEPSEEVNEAAETSPESRRPSRCSSDSSRLSDDSSSSSTRVEGSRKRKAPQNKGYGKKKREPAAKAHKVDEGEENDAAIAVKTSEDNSSDMDEVYENKKPANDNLSSVASRRPVRRKAKPKNEDFEYDLSNLLKLEAQGYRDSQTTLSGKSTQTKKKAVQDTTIQYDMLNKDCCGSLVTLSRSAVEFARAHMKTSIAFSTSQEQSSIFVRPMLPKVLSRGDKISPKKDSVDDKKDCSANTVDQSKDNADVPMSESSPATKNNTTDANPKDTTAPQKNNPEINGETKKSQNMNPSSPALVPIKFRRQSLEVIKNPIINKNIKDFTKAGMKTKILVIKPINRNKDGTQSVNTPLKFQTIKLKDSNKNSNGEEKSLVVKVPKVDCTLNRSVSEPAPSSSSDKNPVTNENKTNDKIEVTNNLDNNKSDNSDTQNKGADIQLIDTKPIEEPNTSKTNS